VDEHGQTSLTVPPFVVNLDFFNRSLLGNDSERGIARAEHFEKILAKKVFAGYTVDS